LYPYAWCRNDLEQIVFHEDQQSNHYDSEHP
jgi:hypothetical protein